MKKLIAILSVALMVALSVNVYLHNQYKLAQQNLVDINSKIAEAEQKIETASLKIVSVESESQYKTRISNKTDNTSTITTKPGEKVPALDFKTYTEDQFTRDPEAYRNWRASQLCVHGLVIHQNPKGGNIVYNKQDYMEIGMDEEIWDTYLWSSSLVSPQSIKESHDAVNALNEAGKNFASKNLAGQKSVSDQIADGDIIFNP